LQEATILGKDLREQSEGWGGKKKTLLGNSLEIQALRSIKGVKIHSVIERKSRGAEGGKGGGGISEETIKWGKVCALGGVQIVWSLRECSTAFLSMSTRQDAGGMLTPLLWVGKKEK